MVVRQRKAGDRAALRRGNLRVQILVRKHPFFERHGNDLVCQVPISFAQAALGSEIDVPTLEGAEHATIPRGTQSGEVVKLKGRGMPDFNGRGRGDLLVEVVVETPRHLTERQEALLRELAELLSANDLTEIEVEDGDRKIKVRREAAPVMSYAAAPAMHAPAAAPAAGAPAPAADATPAAPVDAVK